LLLAGRAVLSLFTGNADLKWTIAVALVTGFVLAMALVFGGRAMNGPHLGKSDKSVTNSSDCCTR
jgi:hypothetical protein